MQSIVLPTKFKNKVFDTMNELLSRNGIEEELLRFQVSADFINLLKSQQIPTKTPTLDQLLHITSPEELRDCAYFWGGIFPENLQKTQLSPRDFAKILRIAYSQIPDLYKPLVDRTDAILEAFYDAYKSLEEPQREVTKLVH